MPLFDAYGCEISPASKRRAIGFVVPSLPAAPAAEDADSKPADAIGSTTISVEEEVPEA